MKKSPELILIVLESAETELVEKWMAQGYLPNIKKLRDGGVWSKITTPAYISSGCVWPSLTVGVNPGKHGFVFFHRQLKSGTYRIVKRYSEQIPNDYFWIPLSRAGKKVAIMDVPLTRPQKDLNGYLFCNWGDEHPGWKSDSIPKSLYPEIVKEFGQHPLHEWYQSNPGNKEEWLLFKDRLQKGVEKRVEVSEFILGKEHIDFAIINFAEPHWAGHIAWHVHDESHPQHDPEIRKACGDIILHNCIDLDKAVGKIVDQNPNSTFMVVSHIGMTGQTGGELLTTEILNRLGMAGKKPKKGFISTFKEKLFAGSQGVSQGVQIVEKVITPKMMTKIKKLVPERFWDDWTRRYLSLGTNWSKSRAFLVPGDHASLIRVNLKGRDPKGKVEPGEEYRALLKEISEAFYELKEVSTGLPAVSRIEFLQDTLWGDEIDEFPDIAIIWRQGNPIESVESERLGRIGLKEYHKRSGGHSERGFFIFNGPDIKKGLDLELSDTLDIVPTIFSIMSVDAPDYLDGVTLIDKIRN